MTRLPDLRERQAAGRTGDGRERILLAALDEFASRGFDGASTTAIARRCGVTQPLIHYHFGSKEGLWRATVDDLFTRLRSEFASTLQRRMPPAGDARDTFLALVRDFVHFCGRYPQFPRLLYLELPVDSPRKTWLMETWVAPVAGRIVELHPTFAKATGMKPVSAGHLMAALTGAAATLFTLGDFMNEAYGIDARAPGTADTHADLLMSILESGLFGPASA